MYFIVPDTRHKYAAVLPDGRKIYFGDRRYQQYRDTVPVELGGGQWSHLDHNDLKRRDSYRKRAGGQKCGGVPCVSIPLTPAWFSYNYLW